ncbi:MAG: hypothetical protein WBB42_13170 [Polyangiales bacterium]
MLIIPPMEPPNDPAGPASSPVKPRPVKLGFSLSRDRVALTDLLSRASEAWSRDLGSWVLAMLLYWLIGMGIPFALSLIWGLVSAFQKSGADTSAMFVAVDVIVQVVLFLIHLVISGVFTLGLWAMAIRGLHGKPTTVGTLFSQLSKIGKYIVQTLAVALGAALIILPIVVIVWLVFVGPVDLETPMSEIMDDAGRPFALASMLLLPLYVYIVTGIAFIQAELAFNDDAGPIEAIIYSWRIARGKRWRIIGVGLLAMLIFVGSAAFCGIGLLFGAPLAILLLAALYLGLRNGADVPPANTATTVGR